EETYITSEHSYQKPQPLGHGCRAGTDLLSSEDEESSSLEEDQEFLTGHKHCLQFSCKAAGVSERRSCAGGNAVLVCNQGRSSEEQEDTHLQWQLNLLSHIENVQNEVTSRMDLIEKEVD
ncbi:P20L1 protein, partial [Jacana jacana]|nr:P20L1 protein [Jacana jacana]